MFSIKIILIQTELMFSDHNGRIYQKKAEIILSGEKSASAMVLVSISYHGTLLIVDLERKVDSRN